MRKYATYKSEHVPTWCPGCGDFSILTALTMAMADLALDPSQTVVVGGIGCSGKLPQYLTCYGFEGIHGRPLPAASAIKLVNPQLTVIVQAGDGDTYGIGMGHFIHTMRRNIDLTVIVHNNGVYGLTKGQTSPTAEPGFRSPSTPEGVIERMVNPLALALAADATFVARAFSGDLSETKQLIAAGIKHKGFALIDVFQPCVTFNHVNTYTWYREHIVKLADDPSFDPRDKQQAFQKALQWGAANIPVGIFYREERPTYEDQLPQLANGPLTRRDPAAVDFPKLLVEYR